MDYSMKMVKEIYKSQVYCVKNKTFINFALEKGDTLQEQPHLHPWG